MFCTPGFKIVDWGLHGMCWSSWNYAGGTSAEVIINSHSNIRLSLVSYVENLLWSLFGTFFPSTFRVQDCFSVKLLSQVNNQEQHHFGFSGKNFVLLLSNYRYVAVNNLFHMPPMLGSSKNDLWHNQKDSFCCSAIDWTSFSWIHKFHVCSCRETSYFKVKVQLFFYSHHFSLLILPIGAHAGRISFLNLNHHC